MCILKLVVWDKRFRILTFIFYFSILCRFTFFIFQSLHLFNHEYRIIKRLSDFFWWSNLARTFRKWHVVISQEKKISSSRDNLQMTFDISSYWIRTSSLNHAIRETWTSRNWFDCSRNYQRKCVWWKHLLSQKIIEDNIEYCYMKT